MNRDPTESGLVPWVPLPDPDVGEDDEHPSDREWLFSVDECGTKQTPYYGFGVLVMKSDRRGDFIRKFNALKAVYGITSEVKWNRVNPRNYQFMLELVDWFFRTKSFAFHCIVVCKADIDKALSHGDYDVAWRKFLTIFTENKCRRLAARRAPCEVRVWCDPIQSRYSKADEALNRIANNMLKQSAGTQCRIVAVRPRDSKKVASIQLCDVLLGAVVTSFLRPAQGPSKQGVQQRIADHLGWKDLRAGTYETERKFNIWVFWDKRDNRKIHARAVTLKVK